jgi:HSP20 family protein
MEPILVNEINVSNNIKALRRDLELTQEDLAEAVGISRQSIISLESGRCIPSVPVALAIAHYFNTQFEDIFYSNNQLNRTEESVKHPLGNFHGGELQDAFDKMFDEALVPFRGQQFIAPQMNVYQTNKDIVVEADVPGMKEDDLDIEISDGVLTIKGERKEEAESNTKEYFHREVSYGTFHRAVNLPVEVQEDKAQAEVKHGQLVITIPKAISEQAKVHKVALKVNSEQV